ncbi:hypothetical protein CSOJ01_05800 [Colletotrichum sojae]|uniref:Uncharacterized protein n=1 Tax=Colletotrichum sojae TaxID=2175907 RepID=A0A8H6JDU0_9PEZI|nr:hypothetical protein CSOJ01_05800 [Colletotrichum sojae]
MVTPMSIAMGMPLGVPMGLPMGTSIGTSRASRSLRSKPRAPVKPPAPPTPQTLQEWVRHYEHRSTVSRIPANLTHTKGQKVPKCPDNIGARRFVRGLKHLLESDSVEHHYSGGGPSQILKVSNKLSRGEALKSVSTEEWTNDLFNWSVTAVHQIPGWKHPARVTFYSVNLQHLLINGTD